MIQIKEILGHLDTLAPFKYTESFDNTGLLIGDSNQSVTKALICLDVTDQVIDQAIAEGYDLIIAFHPLIFKGLKSIGTQDRVGRCVTRLIRHDIALIAIHTNLDKSMQGVNQMISQKIGLDAMRFLMPEQTMSKLVTYVPHAHVDVVRESLIQAGAGQIGEYGGCSFSSLGEGTFIPSKNSNPYVGEKEKMHREAEARLEMLVPHHLKSKAVQSLLAAHPYEEVAYDLYPVEVGGSIAGMGMVGELAKPMSPKAFLSHLQTVFGTPNIRYSAYNKQIQTVAVLGGSGAFALGAAMGCGADALVTADLKYHDFFIPQEQLMLIDIGHFESEQFTLQILKDYLSKKIINFAFDLTSVNTNPVCYFT